jgi:signal transduction histidine kinase
LQNAVCDIDDAVAFALRRLAPKAAAKGIAVAAIGEKGLSAACEQRACRRMLSILVDGAIDAGGDKAAVSVMARRLKGIVLLQVSLKARGSASEGAARLRSAVDQSAARELAEAAGGTLVVEELPEGARASIRLALAPPTMANRRQHERFGVS